MMVKVGAIKDIQTIPNKVFSVIYQDGMEDRFGPLLAFIHFQSFQFKEKHKSESVHCILKVKNF